MPLKKYIFIVCDGLSDLPIAELDQQTPLEAAKTPNLDRLAKNGKTGTMWVMGRGVRPNSDDAHLTLLGYKLPEEYPGRGCIEAAGIGIPLRPGDVALRGNLATVDKNLRVLDRRAGRIKDTTSFIKELDGIKIKGIKFMVKPGTGHRLGIVMRGPGLSARISNDDVHYVTEDLVVEDWQGLPVNKIKPLDNSSAAKFTATVLQKFIDISHEKLEKNPLNFEREKKGEPKANYILERGPSYYKKLPSFKEKYGLKTCCLAGGGLYKGLGIIAGMDLIPVEGATGMQDTDIKAKISAARQQIKNYDFIFVHIKGTDIYGENGDFLGKKDFIEKIDKAIDRLDEEEVTIAITADHSTPCSLKDHSADPVPVLIYQKGIVGDRVEKFGERECQKGSLGTLEGKDFLKLFLQY